MRPDRPAAVVPALATTFTGALAGLACAGALAVAAPDVGTVDGGTADRAGSIQACERDARPASDGGLPPVAAVLAPADEAGTASPRAVGARRP